ncbi:hypothetical protein OAO94_02980 [Flavobacteriaceae bacterium]|jgi:hypothetical protein|nr:hypothetical protein [Flavobacteriaceae bacterium]MDC0622740.1 hypothetical protein [Flavobacteriaceae bacterium]MDC1320863.1 hypothetical protein [Flavobacteriaceae bacterium]
MLQILSVILVLLVTAGLLYWINSDTFQNKHKKYILIFLWVFVAIYSYKTINSVYEVIQFDDLKEVRYQKVIKNLIDIRDSELAHRSVKGQFQNNWDSLVKFIELDSFTLTQRRDSSILDKEMTKRYGGVKTYKDIVIVDTLGFVSVKDSLFGVDNRYTKMMYVPGAKDADTKFELRSGYIEQNGLDIPVFESKVVKSVILYDQNKDLIFKENLVQSVDGVNGSALKVGSMDEVNTNGNWPKNYTKNQ